MADITMKEGEAKTITFTITDSSGVVDVSSATLDFTVKLRKDDATALFSKADGDFNKAQAASGVVSLLIDDTDSATPGQYLAELKITFSATDIDKSADLVMKIQKAVA